MTSGRSDAKESTWREPLRMPWGIRAACWALDGLSKLGTGIQSFEVDELLKAASKKAGGLSDFGDDRFLEALSLRVRYQENRADLTAVGRTVSHRLILGPLINRLRIRELMKRHPEIQDQKIVKPLYVVALPRTGTSLLFNLLAQDPTARPLLFWESATPVPANYEIPTGATEDDPRVKEAVFRVERALRYAPALKKVHRSDPRGPEECVGLLANAYMIPVADYKDDEMRAWLESLDESYVRAAYEEYHEQLKILQWQNAAGHWLLKSPMHLFGLSTLMDVLPDSCVVQTHRDPAKSLPSVCSLTATAIRPICSTIDVDAVGVSARKTLKLWLDRGIAAREKHDASRFHDAHYAELLEDPVPVVRRIYEQFDYEYTDEFEARMMRFIKDNPQHKHGEHVYSAEEFGLDLGEISREFSGYRERFGIPEEG